MNPKQTTLKSPSYIIKQTQQQKTKTINIKINSSINYQDIIIKQNRILQKINQQRSIFQSILQSRNHIIEKLYRTVELYQRQFHLFIQQSKISQIQEKFHQQLSNVKIGEHKRYINLVQGQHILQSLKILQKQNYELKKQIEELKKQKSHQNNSLLKQINSKPTQPTQLSQSSSFQQNGINYIKSIQSNNSKQQQQQLHQLSSLIQDLQIQKLKQRVKNIQNTIQHNNVNHLNQIINQSKFQVNHQQQISYINTQNQSILKQLNNLSIKLKQLQDKQKQLHLHQPSKNQLTLICQNTSTQFQSHLSPQLKKQSQNNYESNNKSSHQNKNQKQTNITNNNTISHNQQQLQSSLQNNKNSNKFLQISNKSIQNLHQQLNLKNHKIQQLQHYILQLQSKIKSIRYQSDQLLNNLQQNAIRNNLYLYPNQHIQLLLTNNKLLKIQLSNKNQQLATIVNQTQTTKNILIRVLTSIGLDQQQQKQIIQQNDSIVRNQRIQQLINKILRKDDHLNNSNNNEHQLHNQINNQLNNHQQKLIKTQQQNQQQNQSINQSPNQLPPTSSKQIQNPLNIHHFKPLYPNTILPPKLPIILAPFYQKPTINLTPLLLQSVKYHNKYYYMEQKFLINNLSILTIFQIQNLLKYCIYHLQIILEQIKNNNKINQKNILEIIHNIGNYNLQIFFKNKNIKQLTQITQK